MLLNNPEVQDELKLDTAQRGRAREIVQEIENKGDRFGDFLKMDRDQRDGVMIEDMRRHELEITALLNESQRARFDQLALQSRGILAFHETTVIERLKV